MPLLYVDVLGVCLKLNPVTVVKQAWALGFTPNYICSALALTVRLLLYVCIYIWLVERWGSGGTERQRFAL